MATTVLVSCPTHAQNSTQENGTAGMKRRQDRRDDRGERLQERDDRWVERRTDPIGVRGPERRTDRRDLRNDRRADRRERVM